MPRLPVTQDRDTEDGTAKPDRKWAVLAVPLAFLAWAIIDAIVD